MRRPVAVYDRRRESSATRILVNELTWSKSRDAAFSECKRRYWFHYYGSWGGWEPDADTRTREIYLLKQLTTRFAWIGSVVHSAIERTLKNHQASQKPLAMDVDQIVRITIEQMRADFKGSRSGLYRFKPKSRGLIEHEYDLSVPDEEWKKAARTVERCLRNFYSSDTYARLLEIPRGDWLEIEEFSSFELGGVRINVVLDFCYREGDEIVIVDWKTGAADESDSRLQLACYTLYASLKWGVPPGKVRAVEVNLNRNERIEHRLSPDDISRTRSFIMGSVADMVRMLHDPSKNIAREEDFPRVNDPRICLRCNFLRVCSPELPSNHP